VRLAQYFRDWVNVFSQAKFDSNHPQVLIIQMYMSVVKMIATLKPSPYETKWDASMTHFGRIVDLAEDFMRQEYINAGTDLTHEDWQINGVDADGQVYNTTDRLNESSQSTSTSPDTINSAGRLPDSESTSENGSIKQTFTLAHGIVTPLHMVCTRCRDPSIRRRALYILQTCNRKEGIWDSAQSALVAERVMQIEETAAGGFITDASQIPTQARIEQLETSFGPGRKPGKIMYTMNGSIPPNTIVEYLGNESGRTSWVAREEDMLCRSFFAKRFAVLPRQTLLS
jgi:hypothetical protein